MDIYLTASQFGKYSRLATSTSVNNCYLFLALNTFTGCCEFQINQLKLVKRWSLRREEKPVYSTWQERAMGGANLRVDTSGHGKSRGI